MRRRDVRGRGLRGPLLPAALPAWRSRRAGFDALVAESFGRLGVRWGEALNDVDLAVEDVPPSDPASWEAGRISLGRVFPAERHSRARVVVYRRPVEARADGDLAELVHHVVVEQVALLLGRRADEIDPQLGE